LTEHFNLVRNLTILTTRFTPGVLNLTIWGFNLTISTDNFDLVPNGMCHFNFCWEIVLA
jgi:hypothetical protein